MANVVLPRSEIPAEHTWDVGSIFPSDADWEHAARGLTERLPSLEQFRGRLADGPAVLLDWMQCMESVFRDLGRIYVYASMVHDVDTADTAAKAKNDRALSLYSRVGAGASFSDPEILDIGLPKIREWIEQEPRLALYAHYFDDLYRRQEHVRSPEIEEILGLVVDPFMTASATHGILADTDLTFRPAHTSTGESVALAQGNVDALLSDADREVRRTTWESYADAHLAVKNTMASCLAAGVKQHVFTARARRYNSALKAALLPNHIPVEVFYRLIETFKANLPIWHRYWRIRKRGLGYDTLHEYDIKAPLTAVKPLVSYEQAVDWIITGMRPLGPEYIRTLEGGVTQQRWVDVYPNQGKRNGAYSTGWPGTHPFILMSFTEDLESMSALAHELGHSLHSYYTWQNQPLVYSWYGTFVAEVASNFNQALVRSHLLAANSDPEFQIAVIEEAMSNFHRYFFIMPTLARFELEIHERVERGGALTANELIALLADLFAEGYGQEIDIDVERTGITWAEFSTHMYANFYVFQYATGIAAAHALAEGVLSETPGARDRYLAFLKAGGSLYPLDALRLAGVDMTSAEPVQKAFEAMSHMVDRLPALLERRSTIGAGPL